MNRLVALFLSSFGLAACSTPKNHLNITEHCHTMISDKIEPSWHVKEREAVTAYYEDKKNPPLNKNFSYSAKLLIIFDNTGKITKVTDITANRHDFVSFPAIRSLDGFSLSPELLQECFKNKDEGPIRLEWDFILKT